MIFEHSILLNGIEYPVIVTDEPDSLQAAYAAGKAVIAIWDPKKADQSLSPARYAVQDPKDADPSLLMKAVCRRFSLPMVISATDRLVIREFSMEDLPSIPAEEEAGDEDNYFRSADTLYAYIKNQYGFFEYGIWAVCHKKDGTLIGKAGITQFSADSCCKGQEIIYCISSSHPDIVSGSSWTWEDFLQLKQRENFLPVELSYHIFRPFRRKGYALEASRAIISYSQREISKDIFLRIDKDNIGSQRLRQILCSQFVKS